MTENKLVLNDEEFGNLEFTEQINYYFCKTCNMFFHREYVTCPHYDRTVN